MIKTYNLLDLEITVDTDANTGEITSWLQRDEDADGEAEDSRRSTAIEGIEILLLSLACEGVDIGTEEYLAALQTALEAVEQNL